MAGHSRQFTPGGLPDNCETHCVSGNRTHDLPIVSPTRYQLCHRDHQVGRRNTSWAGQSSRQSLIHGASTDIRYIGVGHNHFYKTAWVLSFTRLYYGYGGGTKCESSESVVLPSDFMRKLFRVAPCFLALYSAKYSKTSHNYSG